MLGESNFQSQKDSTADFDLEEREIINRLKEDPLLIIKKTELKHMKIVEEYNRKRDELVPTKMKFPPVNHRVNRFRKSSLSRSPEIARFPDSYSSHNLKHSANSRRRPHPHASRLASRGRNDFSRASESYREEKLQNMMSYGRLVQNERNRKFCAKNTSSEDPAKCPKYLQEIRSKINQEQISSLEQRMKFMRS